MWESFDWKMLLYTGVFILVIVGIGMLVSKKNEQKREEEEREEAVRTAAPILIACPACNKQVSSHAAACPSCGQPINAQAPATIDKTWSPGLAAVLSFFIPGAGQIYRGRIGSGLLWLVFVVGGYLLFIFPGLILHILCIISAASGKER